jgi:type VI secretion system secreted protein VgrG
MALSQTDRLIRIATPLGEDTFVVLSFNGFEEISDLFSFKLELASERSDIAFEQLAYKNVTVGIKSSDGSERFFNGIIIEFAPAEVSTEEGYSTYFAVMAPAFWVLSGCVDHRIFQDKSVPDIIREVLAEASLGPKGVRQKIDIILISQVLPDLGYALDITAVDCRFQSLALGPVFKR